MEGKKRPIEITVRKDQNELEATTEFFLSPACLAANAINSVGNSIAKDHIDFEYAKVMLEKSMEQLKRGDLSEVEEMLFSQSYALNALFTSMVARASRQEYFDNLQAFMNLALKAQNQSRATLQALIQLKQPSQTAFIKQTNIAHGNQQVNNGHQLEEKLNPQNELLEQVHDLDSREKATAESLNSQLETLDPIDRGEDARRKG